MAFSNQKKSIRQSSSCGAWIEIRTVDLLVKKLWGVASRVAPIRRAVAKVAIEVLKDGVHRRNK